MWVLGSIAIILGVVISTEEYLTEMILSAESMEKHDDQQRR